MTTKRRAPTPPPKIDDMYTIATKMSTNTGSSEKSRYSKKLLIAEPRSSVRITSPVRRLVWKDIERCRIRSNMSMLMFTSEYHATGNHSRFCATVSRPPEPWNSLSVANAMMAAHGDAPVLSASTTRPSAIGTSRFTTRPSARSMRHTTAVSCSRVERCGHRYGASTRMRWISVPNDGGGGALLGCMPMLSFALRTFSGVAASSASRSSSVPSRLT